MKKNLKNFYNRFGSRVLNLLRNSKISRRLRTSFLMLSVGPIILISAFSYYTSYKDNEEKSIQYSKNISTQVMENISNVFDNYVEQFEGIAMDNTTVAQIYTYDDLKINQQVEVYSQIRYNLASIVCTSKGIDAFEIRTKSAERIYCGAPITADDMAFSDILLHAMDSDLMVWDIGKKEIGGGDTLNIVLAKKMVLQFEEDITGFAVMTIDRRYIDNICSQNTDEESMQIIITDEDGTIISHPDNSMVLSHMDDKIMNGISDMEDTGGTNERFFKTNIDGEELLVSYNILSRNKWRVISIIPYSYLMQSTVKNMRIAFIVVAVLIIFSVWVASFVTKSISMPVKHLIMAMDEAGWGNLKVRMDETWTDSRDEHAQLAQGFNDMTARLQTLIDEVYRSEINKRELEFRKKEAELNALQQQINPHFLYNTLETIYWMAMSKGEDEIGEMVTALGNFFRKSINKGIEYVTVAEEVQNVQYYVYLQKIRFQERFNVVWDIDEKINSYRIIKLVLQPIIENAIIHGVESLECGGLIIVKGYEKSGKLCFEVRDNGKGMSAQKVCEFEEYINRAGAETDKSVGLKNVHQRIRLYYGEEYGIHISSSENKGTKVVLELPATSKEPKPVQRREDKDV